MNKNILVVGHKEHGKSTVAQMISDNTGFKYEDSSMASAKLFVYPLLKDKYGYSSLGECYKDRRNRRAEWYKLICDYNKQDKSRLAKDIMKDNDIYVGMRDVKEISMCKVEKIFDLIIGVFDPNKPLEDESSFNFDLFKASDIIITAGDLEKTRRNVKLLTPICYD